jgi:predicted dehydrogenase
MPVVPEGVERVADFRRVIDRPDIDAVVVAAPDHWHAIMTIAACRAGKDVYCEKPLSITIHEGRAMVNAAREHQRIVQVGTHRRASRMYARLAELVQTGALGKVTGARIGYASNMAPTGIGRAPDSAPPEGLDWDLWLGPRAERPFNPNVLPYKFRWHHLYSSQVGNWGVHYFDLVRWLTGEAAPTAVAAIGSRAGVDDDRTIPVSSESIFEHSSGLLTQFSLYESNGQPLLADGAEVELRGTLGTLRANIKGYKIIPEKGGQFQDPRPRRDPETGPGDAFDLDVQAARDFLDNVKARKRPIADVEEGHRSTIYAHLANIAMTVRERLTWDSAAERFTGTGADAANALLHYEYRKPWSL